MAILILNYDLAQQLGSDKVVLEAGTVGELIDEGIARYGEPFRRAAESAAIVLNGRSISLLKGKKTKLAEDDQLWFLQPSSGG